MTACSRPTYMMTGVSQHGGLMWDADSATQLHTSNTPRSWITGTDPAVTPARPQHAQTPDHSRSHARTYIVTRYYTRARSPIYWHIDYWTRAMQRRAFNQQQTVRTRYRRTDGRSYYTHLPTATRHACPLQLIRQQAAWLVKTLQHASAAPCKSRS